MNLNSLRTKITLIFLITFITILALIPLYVEYEKKELYRKTKIKYELISNYVSTNYIHDDEITPYIESLNFHKVRNEQRILSEVTLPMDGRDFHIILYENEYYLYINTPIYRLLYKDLEEHTQDKIVYLLFFLIFLILISIYWWLIRSLRPLYELKNDIVKFASGDLSVSCASNKKDEIAEVANEFDKAVKQIDLLLHSRQLFLRTVMHELKTPIAKGRIVSELLFDEKQKGRFIFIFDKLNFLIDDFAKVEEIVSNNCTPNLQAQKVEAVVHNAVEMLMLDKPEEKISMELLENTSVKADFSLLSMVIKNLIDNGLKYSVDRKVHIVERENRLEVHSKGEALRRSLESYFKPFHNEADMSKQGMGLGLYIIKSVLDMHEMGFSHAYEEGVNIFIVSF